MNKLVLLSLPLLLASTVTHAMALTGYVAPELCIESGAGVTPSLVATCSASWTTSFPTFLFQGEEINLNSDEASQRLVAEAFNAEMSPIMSEALSSQLKVPSALIMQTVRELYSAQRPVSSSAVVQALLQK